MEYTEAEAESLKRNAEVRHRPPSVNVCTMVKTLTRQIMKRLFVSDELLQSFQTQSFAGFLL